jgi:M6 family metalloprotease-like protein
MRIRGVGTIGLIALALLAPPLLGGVPAAQAETSPYPAPTALPDFSQAQDNLPYYSPAKARGTRPVLVLYESFTDTPEPSGKNAAWLQQRVFGSDRSVAKYFAANSSGQLHLEAAKETQGAVNDGVVEVPANETFTTWAALPSDSARIRAALRRADQSVDFASFDKDVNHKITPEELVLIKMEVQPCDDGTAAKMSCAAFSNNNRTTNYAAGEAADPLVLDGITIDGDEPVAQVNSSVDYMTIAHEVMHQVTGITDYYEYGIDGYDVMETTLLNHDFYTQIGSWHRLRLGWQHPTVVTHDGYYSVSTLGSNSNGSSQGYLLYDPAEGADRYFVVENREQTSGTYDDDANQQHGLNVWAVNRPTFYPKPAAGGVPPIGRVRPCAPAATACDFFGVFDGTAARREFQLPWTDGRQSRIAIRAVQPAGPVVRAYFDVPGPGVMVECQATPITLRTDEVSNVSVPVTNTGDQAGAFTLSAAVPQGWVAAGTPTVFIPAHTRRVVNMRILAKAEWQQRFVTFTARSVLGDSVGSDCRQSVSLSLGTPAGSQWASVMTTDPWSARSTPPDGYQRSSLALHNTVERTGIGAYTVTFTGMTTGGVPHVRAYGPIIGNCYLGGWATGVAGVRVDVRCVDLHSRPRDNTFAATYTNARGAIHRLAYAFVDDPQATPPAAAQPPPTVEAGPGNLLGINLADLPRPTGLINTLPGRSTTLYEPRVQFDGGGGRINVVRRGIGSYRVSLVGQNSSAVAMATAVGIEDTRCEAHNRSDDPSLTVDVTCTRGNDRVDTKFVVSILNHVGLSGLLGPVGYNIGGRQWLSEGGAFTTTYPNQTDVDFQLGPLGSEPIVVIGGFYDDFHHITCQITGVDSAVHYTCVTASGRPAALSGGKNFVVESG